MSYQSDDSLYGLSIFKLLGEVLYHLSRRRYRQIIGLLGLMLFNGLIEMITLGAILPFLTVVIAPEKIFKYSIVHKLSLFMGWTTSQDLVLPLTLAFSLTALMAGATKLSVLWINTRISNSIGHELSVNVYRHTLYQSYDSHLKNNTSNVISAVEKVSVVVELINQFLILLSAVVISGAIVLMLSLIQPIVAALVFLGFGSTYLLIIRFTRKRLIKNSEIVASQANLRMKLLQEGLGGIREIILDSSQLHYCELYRRVDYPYRLAWGNTRFISIFPRYAMESLGIVLIAILAYGLSQQPGGGSIALPLLGMLALSTQRLLPALQQIYNAWAIIQGNKGSLIDVLRILQYPLSPLADSTIVPALAWRSSIEFAAVSFRYEQDSPWILNDLDLKITKGARIGFVGSTGSGKSTAVDLLMGLLEPTLGNILVDGQCLNELNSQAWRKNIAHVPQSIYLADTTVAENIAFGVPAHQIDYKLIKKVARQSQIADFIEKRPLGYLERIGERGIRLSGGQRQRLGIARALYKKSSVLILDEATSALDNVTENDVMTAINNLSRDLTIILIAHRLTTVQNCDLIVELDRGRVVAQGTYEELMLGSPSFQLMAKGYS
jgi:ATP-binding cassette, subfamily B, bacterial PglK